MVRHNVGVSSYMTTARPDRGNNPREKQKLTDLTNLMQTYNAQSFISMTNQRLCIGCVSKETRELIEEIVWEVKEIEPEIAFHCVPNCVLYGACKEDAYVKCNHYKDFIKKILLENEFDASKVVSTLINIDSRYKAYHKFYC